MRAGGLRHGVVRLRLHRMHQVGELHRVLDEEDGDVVAHQVPVALVGVELHREAAHVARGVLGAALARHGGEAHEHRRDLAGRLERGGAREFGERLVALEVAVRRRATRVHDALGDALVVEVRELVPQDEVFQQHRAAQAVLQGVLVVGDGHAQVGRQGLAGGVGAHAIQPPVHRVHALGGLVAGLLRGVHFGHGAARGQRTAGLGGDALRWRQAPGEAMLQRLVVVRGHGPGQLLGLLRLAPQDLVGAGGVAGGCLGAGPGGWGFRHGGLRVGSIARVAIPAPASGTPVPRALRVNPLPSAQNMH